MPDSQSRTPSSTRLRTVTLRTVAEEAGVSVSTASRALNGQARQYRISKATEDNVRQTAQRLGFQPSQVARSLRLQRSELIGVVVPDLSNPFFASIAREVSLGAEAGGYSVLLGDSREDTEIEKRLCSQLRSRQVEALVVCPVGIEADHLIELDRAGLPLVLVDRAFDQSDLLSVTSNNLVAGKDVADVLIHNGHRKIGVLMGIPQSLPARRRLEGVTQAMKQASIEFDEQRIAGSDFTERSGYLAAKTLMQSKPDTTGIVAMSTTAAIGGMRALIEMGYRVPEDVSIVTFDDHPFSELMQTPLTTSAQDVAGLGRTATEVLIQRLKTKRLPKQRRWEIETQLLEKSSVTAPRQGDADRE